MAPFRSTSLIFLIIITAKRRITEGLRKEEKVESNPCVQINLPPATHVNGLFALIKACSPNSTLHFFQWVRHLFLVPPASDADKDIKQIPSI